MPQDTSVGKNDSDAPPPATHILAKTLVTPSGAIISYRQVTADSSSSLPAKPPLIYFHGALEAWQSHLDLALELASSFTVYLPDRRGRGRSSPHRIPASSQTMQDEVDDAVALARATGARLVGGISSGAIVALAMALRKPDLVDKVVAYEPPLALDQGRFEQLLPRYHEQVARGDVTGALVTGARLTEMGPWFVRTFPEWLVRPLVGLVINTEEGWRKKEQANIKGVEVAESDQTRPGPDEGLPSSRSIDGDEPVASMRNLVPTMAFDFALASEMGGNMDDFTRMKPEVLVLCGTATRPFLMESCDRLESLIPRAKQVKLEGLDHLSSGNRAYDGQPEVVANAMKSFYSTEKAILSLIVCSRWESFRGLKDKGNTNFS